MINDIVYVYAVLAVISILTIIISWYCYGLLNRLYSILETVELARERLDTYSDHIEKVYSMDTYTGDETIKHLLEHSKDMKVFCDNINFSFLPEEPEGEINEEEEIES